ncbi:EpsG family protein [Nesterenkonia haasae]|uniref:EpsG family protein n=1 Tax=Nesterenkonia haasae TaxID=2587813 RepID=UPI0013907E31|nr:EpsG family protein [Nesterenkonia haasae]NDK33004.1 hypothetical protein [Nesterenkonia haasae]
MTLLLFCLASIWIVAFCVLGQVRFVRHWTNTLFPLAALVAVNTIVAVRGNFDVVDKMRYGREFEVLSFTSFGEVVNEFITTGREPAFLMFNWIIGLFTRDMMVFFTVTAIVCNLLLILALWMVLGSGWQAAVVFFATFCFGFFIDYSSFLLRQGLSISFLLLGLALVLRNARLLKVIALLTVGVLFHWSALPAAVIILLVKLVRWRAEVVLGLWVLASVTYLTGMNARLAGPLGSSIEQVETYADPELAVDYLGGTNRPVFWLLSAVPLIFAYVAARTVKFLPSWYAKLFTAYVLLNCYFLLLGFVYFNDRLAAYSWSLIPLLVCIPLLAFQGRGQTVARLGLVAGFVAWGVYFGSFTVLTPV